MDRFNHILVIFLVLFLGGTFVFLLTGPEITGSFIGAGEEIEITASPWNITISDDTVLDKDYIFFDQHGIKFNSDDIILDCDNHKLILNNGDNRKAINLNKKDRITIKNCIFINWTHSAINEGSSSDNTTIQNNRFEDNERSINFKGNDSEISNNLIISGGGIEIKKAAHRIQIENNTITITDSNRHGLLLKSENNIARHNIITINGGKDGVRLANGSKNNEIYYNNIILTNGDNTAKDKNSESNQNIWDDGSCAGNYWSDYSGNGTYSISNGKGTDNYPLLNQWPADYDTNNNGLADCGECEDFDGDGFNLTGDICGILDCNDSDVNICPGALEACDNTDNDCDGQTDEDLNETQSCGLGICSGGSQIRVCSTGIWGDWSECSTNGLTTNEICNGLDDNCDGEIDEGNFTIYNGTDVGICQQSITECINGSMIETQAKILPGQEICDDGLDNDCDGLADEECSSAYAAPSGGGGGGTGGGGGGGSAPEETVEETSEEETTETALTALISPANIPPITARAVANTVRDMKWELSTALVVMLTLTGLFAYKNPKVFKINKRRRNKRR